MTNPYDPTFPGQPIALPSADSVLTPCIDVLVGNPASLYPGVGNPRRGDHLWNNTGYWSNVIAGWKAQARLNLRRVADEMMQARLPLASGVGLRELAKSKYFTDCIDTGLNAIGTVVFLRTDSSNVGGAIPSGTRIRRNANPTAFPFPLQGADFVTLNDIVVPNGSPMGTVFAAPIQCTTTGEAGNILIEAQPTNAALPNVLTTVIPGTDLQITDNIPFGTFSVSLATCAGGASRFLDPDVRRICHAQPQGRRGPTSGALSAGALLASGVRHVAEFEDLVNANSVIFFADTSWASDAISFTIPSGVSTPKFWATAVQQSISDGWQGFGCALSIGGLVNVTVDIAATIQLRSSRLLNNTQKILEACNAAIQSYLDDRDDFFVIKNTAMRALLARAHPGILTCTSVTATNRATNQVVSSAGFDMTNPSTLTPPPALVQHYFLTSFTPNFVVPQ